MRVCVVAAHPDDEVLGAGGAITKHIDAGDEVTVLILGSGLSARLDSPEALQSGDLAELHTHAHAAAKIMGVTDFRLLDFPDNRFDSVALLDIVKAVEEVFDSVEPEMVYTHHPSDLNIDHQRTVAAVLTASRPQPGVSVKRILAMEVPSATGWGDPAETFAPTVFLDIENELERKVQAMAAYDTELREFPHARSLESIEAKARAWGAQVGLKAAEPFVLLREVVA